MRDHGVSSRTHADEVDRHAQHLLDVLHVLPRVLWQLLEGPHTTLTHRSLLSVWEEGRGEISARKLSLNKNKNVSVI